MCSVLKRLYAIILVVCIVFLTGCSHQRDVNAGLALRDVILKADACTFRTVITADYIDRVYTFQIQCKFDKTGNMEFTVIEPELISGITGCITAESGKLTFDDQLLVFELLADGQLTPVSAPWVFMKALRSGYIHSFAQNDEVVQMCINDSYNSDALEVDIHLNAESHPFYAEILWMNRRILSLSISDFCIL